VAPGPSTRSASSPPRSLCVVATAGASALVQRWTAARRAPCCTHGVATGDPKEERQLWPSSDRSWSALSNVGRPGWLPGSRASRPAEPLARRTAQTPSGQRSGADGAPSCSAECPRLEHCRSTRHGRVAVSVRRCPGARQCSGAMRASARRPPVTGRGFCSDALCRSWDWVWSRSPMGIGCAGLLCSSSLGAESELDNRPDLYV
jgi:hypothetical protein